MGPRSHFHRTLVICYEFAMRSLFSLPRFHWINLVKVWFLRLQGAQVGKRVVLYPGVWISPGRNLIIADDVDLALDVIVTTGGGVTIGARTLVGYRTQILSSNHKIPDRQSRIFDAGHESKQVLIGDDVWIGASCIILPGTVIGNGAVIAAGAVVTSNIPEYSIAAGVPARVIKERQ